MFPIFKDLMLFFAAFLISLFAWKMDAISSDALTWLCEQDSHVGGEGEPKQKTTVPLGGVGCIGDGNPQDKPDTQ